MGSKVKKVPVILQMDALECGVASLAMILAYYKKYITLEKLRIDCNVSRDGSNAKYILMAARKHGLIAKGYRYEVNNLKENITFPAIIHWNFNHFVVLNGFKKNNAVINDPDSGLIEVDMDSFNKSYTGIVLEFNPCKDFKKEEKPKGIITFIFKRVSGSLLSLIFIFILGFILTTLEMIKPIFYKLFVDRVLLGNAPDWMKPIVFSMVVVLIIGFLVELIQSIYLFKVETKISISASSMFIWHTLKLPVEFFSQRLVGDICERENSNNYIAPMLCEKLAPIALHIVMIGFYFFFMMYYNPTMALLGLLMALINIFFINKFSQKNMNCNKNMKRDSGKLSGMMISGISMIETIKANGAEYGFFEKLAGYQAKYTNSYLETQKIEMFMQIIPMLLTGICNTLILIIGVYNILLGKMTIGTLMAFQGYMELFLTPTNELFESIQTIQDISGDIERIEDVMNYRANVKNDFSASSPNHEYEKLSGDVELRDISFGYSPLSAPLISDFNLKAKKGSMIAFVGGSGSGKTTIAKLIAGMYNTRSGEVLFDSRQKKNIDRYVFTSSVAVVEQNIVLFSDTVRNNITMWDETINEETIIAACKAACIHDDIVLQKEGYDSFVKEGGANFSGGQRQCIEIARALVLNPSIIILDEATSALDSKIERKIMDSIKRRGITCFIIAHRLSAIRGADEIIMLEQGKEVERGTHEELIKKDGKYSRLIKYE